MSYYLKNTFFNTFHKFEGGDGKRLRDLLCDERPSNPAGSTAPVGPFSFLVAVASDEMSNAEKRDAKPWTDADKARCDAALAIRDNFANTCGAIAFAGTSREAASTYATFYEKNMETFRKVSSSFTTNDEPVKADASALDGA